MLENTTFSRPLLEQTYALRHITGYEGCTPHRHQYWELILFTRGSGNHTINEKPVRFTAGDIALLAPTDVHEILADKGTTIDCFSVAFSYHIYNKQLEDVCRFRNFPVLASLRAADYLRAQRMMETLKEEFENHHRPGSIIFSINIIEQLIILLRRNLSDYRRRQQNDPSKSVKMLLYIQQHFAENITAEKVAEEMNYSPKYFSAVFSREFGVPFQDYLKTLRLNYAYHLIKNTDKPIIDICYDSGFRSPTYFSKAFKQFFGTPPSAMRAEITE